MPGTEWDPYIGQIIAVGFKGVPKGWLACDGSLYDITQHNALFTLLGFAYGGGGTSFAVPDLRGRLVVSQGQGRGRLDYALGEIGGQEHVTLSLWEIQPHSHALMAINQPGGPEPHGTDPPTYGPDSVFLLAQNTQTKFNMYAAGPPDVTLSPYSLDMYRGRSQPHENRQPFQVINYIICDEGIYPSRP